MEVREQLGLSTQEALSRLHQDIEVTVDEYEASRRARRYELWLKDALHHWSQYTTLCWSSALSLACIGIALIACHFVDDHPQHGSLVFQGVLILTLVGINVYLVVRDNRLRHSEIPQRVRRLLVKLKAASTSCLWVAENYPHLCSPLSPCITLQWAFRDGKLVNLPWALLVAGDVIEMRPGQASPGNCVPLEPGASLTAGQVWSPAPREPCSAPAARDPLPSARFRLQATPYLGNLRLALAQALDRPVTCFNRQRHLLAIACVEHLLLPIVAVCAVAAGWLRLKYISSWAGPDSWTETLVLRPVAASLPLLPIVFPAAWLVLDSLGLARIQARLFNSTHSQAAVDPFDEPAAGVSERVSWRQLANNFCDVWRGEGDIPSRSANLLHVLGSVTALCCVDKKGILSWPNPTAEKVFFLRTSSHSSNDTSLDSLDRGEPGEANQSAPLEEDNEHDEILSNYNMSNADSSCKTVAEVLDLTHDRTSSFRLQFDDHAWRTHAASLKPLGLAILLNTCNMRTQDHYTRFCAHVTCQAMHNEDLVPVINRRRCLCELARQIGFVDSAKDIFKLEEQLSTFRHVQPEMVRRDTKFARSLSLNARVKFPFPHMVAVVVRDVACGGLQLLSQGTADMVLDSCVEFWDGSDLAPFSPADRKKVQDFYQRTSLTAYCSAFAYRPLTGELSSRLSDVYLELPADGGHLYVPHRSPTPLLWDCRPGLDSRARGMQFHSTDSLLCGDLKDEVVSDAQGCFEVQCNQVFIGMVTMQYQAQIDMVQLIDQLERACIRFVHFSKENELRSRVFSEKMGLESGWNCHISLLSDKSERTRSEGELTSTSGAAKPGRHLSSPSTSLPKCPTNQKAPRHDGDDEETAQLIERTVGNMSRCRALSLSAPSAINMEYSQVKFDDECEEQHSVHSPTEEMEGWRSMSCLTDSTEQSAPVNFDMSNRAKLPRGIDKIRPHLEQIDNVPLLVSLFTDCNPGVTREMLHIMQEYGEVVCVMGSSANADNMPILLQADASCAVEPLYPQVCQSVPAFVPPPTGPSPVDLSRALNSVACSLSFRREQPVSLYRLVAESRHFMQGLWNSVQFWTCCCISLSLTQLLALVFMLPPLLTTGQVLWLVCVVIPALALSLAALPTDFKVMQRATGKNQCSVTKQMAVFVFWCYGCKFVAPVLTQLSFSALTLAALCGELAARGNGSCAVVYPRIPSGSGDPGGGGPAWGGWTERHETLHLVQHLVMLSTVLHFVVISVSFVQRKYSLLDRSPFSNYVWFLVVTGILGVQAGFSWTYLTAGAQNPDDLSVSDVPLTLLVPHLTISPVLVFAVVEIIKREEVKADIRFQKRERLDFDTKLGMNSPF